MEKVIFTLADELACIDSKYSNLSLFWNSVKGYEKSKVNLNAIKPVEQELLKSLMATKKNLLLELSHYLANAKLNKDNLE